MANDAFNAAAKAFSADDLLEAIEKGDVPRVKGILASRQVTDLNQPSDRGWTPLLLAISKADTDSISALLDAGADVNAREINTWHTPLSRAVGAYYGGVPQVVSLLLSRGANTDSAPINAHEAPLLAAAEKGLETITLMLLSKGANIEIEDDWGKTAVHLAAEKGHAGVIRILSEHGADMNKLGALALGKAIANHSREAFDTLLECAADPAAPLRDGQTLLMVAAKAGETGVMEKLVAAGIDIDAADEEGKTALMQAAEDGKGESARKLLALGANPALISPEGKTAGAIATEAGHEHITYIIDNAPRKGAPAPAKPFRIKLTAKNG
jgi:ankyrin repeat protein